MSTLKKVGSAAGALTLAGGLIAGGATAAGASSRVRGTEYFQISIQGSSERFVAHGPATGGGKDVSPEHKNYDTLHFAHGSMRIKHPNKDSHFTYHANPKTCFFQFKITGTYTLHHGRGSLSGVHGHGSYVVHGYGISPRKNGACNFNTQPHHEVGIVRAHGPISLPA